MKLTASFTLESYSYFFHEFWFLNLKPGWYHTLKEIGERSAVICYLDVYLLGVYKITAIEILG